MISLQHSRFAPQVCSALLAVVFLVSVADASPTTTSFDKPIEFVAHTAKVDEEVALYVPAGTRDYVDQRRVNFFKYSTKFGEGVATNAQAAFAQVFRKVIAADQFPSTASGEGHALRSIELGIVRSEVALGKLTFLPSTAMLELEVRISAGDETKPLKIVRVEGHGRADPPGSRVYMPVPGQPPVEYDWKAAVTAACELALKDALEKAASAASATDSETASR